MFKLEEMMLTDNGYEGATDDFIKILRMPEELPFLFLMHSAGITATRDPKWEKKLEGVGC